MNLYGICSATLYCILLLNCHSAQSKSAINIVYDTIHVVDQATALHIPLQKQFIGGSVVNGDSTAMLEHGEDKQTIQLKIIVKNKLNTRYEPYKFTVQNRKKTVRHILFVKVYPASIENPDQIDKFLNFGWGTLVVYEAKLFDKFPSNHLTSVVRTGSTVYSVTGAVVSPSDSIVIPPGSDSVVVELIWKHPFSRDEIRMARHSKKTNLSPPVISMSEATLTSINEDLGVFALTGVHITAPGSEQLPELRLADIHTEVLYSNLVSTSGESAENIGQPHKQPIHEGNNRYTFLYKITKSSMISRKYLVRGSVTISISASTQWKNFISEARNIKYVYALED